MGDSGAGLHQLQYLRLDQIGQIIPRRNDLFELWILTRPHIFIHIQS